MLKMQCALMCELDKLRTRGIWEKQTADKAGSSSVVKALDHEAEGCEFKLQCWHSGALNLEYNTIHHFAQL